MTQKKYELVENDSITLDDKTLYRIKALIDFSNVKAGELGGFIEKEENLSHNGNAWVTDNAKVFGYALVTGNAKVTDNANVSGYAEINQRSGIIHFSNVGTENGTLTVFAGKSNTLLCTRGCFAGTVDEFLARSAEVHDEKTKREYQLLMEVAKSRILG